MKMSVNQTWDGVALAPSDCVTFTLTWMSDGLEWAFDAPYYGDPAPIGEPGSCWELWNYEVVELFILGEGSPEPYIEIEVGPHGHYLALRLLGERKIVEKELPLRVTTIRESERWSGRVLIPIEYLPKGGLRVNGYAIHGIGEGRVYAVSTVLDSDVPDFHRIEGFRQKLMRS